MHSRGRAMGQPRRKVPLLPMPRASHPRHAHHGQKHNLLLSKPGVRQPRPSFLSHSVRPRLPQPLQDGGFVAPHLRQHSGQMSGRVHNRQPPRSQAYQEDDQYEEEMYYPSRDHHPRRDQPPSPPRHHSPISQMMRASPHLHIDRPSPHEIRRSPVRRDIRRSPPRHEVRPSTYANKTRRSPTRQAIRRSPPQRAGIRQENRHAVHGQVNRRSSVEETGQETDMEEAYRLHREKLSRSIRERKIRQDEESGRNTPNEDDRQPLHDTSHQDEVLSEDPGYEEVGEDAMEQDMSGLSCLAHYLLHIKTLKSKKANEEIENKEREAEGHVIPEQSIKLEAPHTSTEALETNEQNDQIKSEHSDQESGGKKMKIQLSNYVNVANGDKSGFSEKIPFLDESGALPLPSGDQDTSMDGKPSDADDAAEKCELSEETSRKVATDIGFESRHLVITTHFKDVPDNDIPEENRSKKQDLTWFCKVCDMKIMEEKIIHFRTSEHKEKKKWQRPYCDVCDLWFRHPRQLVQHVKAPKHKSMAQTFENDEETNSIQSTSNNTETSVDKDIKTEVVEKSTNADKSDPSDGAKRKTSVDTEEPEGSAKLDIPHIIPVTGYYCDACCDFFFDEGSTLNHIKTESHRVKVKNGSSEASEANKTSAPKAAKRKCKPINGATPKPAKIPNKTSTKPLDWNFVIPKRK